MKVRLWLRGLARLRGLRFHKGQESHLRVPVSADARQRYACGEFYPVFDHVLTRSLEDEGVRLAPRSESWPPLRKAFYEALIKAGEAIAARSEGEVIDTPAAPEPASSHRSTPLFSDAVRVWIAEQERSGWGEKTTVDHRACIDRFIEVAGDKQLDAYSRSDGRRFKTVLMSLPANARKLPKLSGLPLIEAAKRAEALGLKPMSLSTVNKTLRRVSAFWNWAEKHYDEAPRNPLRDLTVTTRVNAYDERSPFLLRVLNRIFASPPFTGRRSVSACSTVGPIIPRHSGHFWAPLIGLFSGLRLGEITKFEATDLREIEGVLVFDTDEDHAYFALIFSSSPETRQLNSSEPSTGRSSECSCFLRTRATSPPLRFKICERLPLWRLTIR